MWPFNWLTSNAEIVETKNNIDCSKLDLFFKDLNEFNAFIEEFEKNINLFLKSSLSCLNALRRDKLFKFSDSSVEKLYESYINLMSVLNNFNADKGSYLHAKLNSFHSFLSNEIPTYKPLIIDVDRMELAFGDLIVILEPMIKNEVIQYIIKSCDLKKDINSGNKIYLEYVRITYKQLKAHDFYINNYLSNKQNIDQKIMILKQSLAKLNDDLSSLSNICKEHLINENNSDFFRK